MRTITVNLPFCKCCVLQQDNWPSLAKREHVLHFSAFTYFSAKKCQHLLTVRTKDVVKKFLSGLKYRDRMWNKRGEGLHERETVCVRERERVQWPSAVWCV